MTDEFKQLIDTKRCLIFDLDGTIADTERIHWQAHNIVLKKRFGIEVDLEHIYTYLGKPESIFLKEIERDYNIDIGGPKGKGYDKYIKERNKVAEKIILKEAEPFPFMKEILKETFGMQVSLVSAQNRHLVDKMLKKWGLLGRFQEKVKFIVDDTKPKPYYYDYIMKEVLGNAEPSDVILFEDVNKFLAEGKKRGFITVGIHNGFGKEELDADYVIDATKSVFTLMK